MALQLKDEPRLALDVQARRAVKGAGGIQARIVGRKGEARDQPALTLAALFGGARLTQLAVAAGPAHVEDANRALKAAIDAAAGWIKGERMRCDDLVHVVEGNIRRAARASVGIPQPHRMVA